MRGRFARSVRRTAGLTGLVLSSVLFTAPAAWSLTLSADIHSAGPLSDIFIGSDLSCQARSGFSNSEFAPNDSTGDCGTFLNTGTGGGLQTELFGPDFANHQGGTKTSFSSEVPFTPVSQSMTGSGTSTNPYQVTTIVQATDPPSTPPGPSAVLQFTEVDSYVVGDDFYRTDFTVKNVGPADMTATAHLYHAADCQLRGSDTGYGTSEPPSGATVTGVACTLAPNNDQVREQLVPITSQGSFTETTPAALWQAISAGGSLPATCPTCGSHDNATGIAWSFQGLAAGASQTFSFDTVIVDAFPTGGFSLSGSAGSTVHGTVATITDPDTSATVGRYPSTIWWGDGTASPGTITGGNGTFNITGSHAYAAGGVYSIQVTIAAMGTNEGLAGVSDTATISAAPSPVVTGAPSVGITRAGFTGSVDPDGLPTTAFFQYGLDPKYNGGGPIVYDHSTTQQSISADFATHAVSASVSGLVPNALYHVRLVATNSAGTSFGPDIAFTTQKAPAPGAPSLGRTFNISPVSGIVLVKVHGVFVPLTQVRQFPKNTLINALHGTLKLTTAGGSSPAHDAAAKGKKVKTQSGTFGGAVFKVAQARNGLATLSLVEGAFKGAPTYATCKAHTDLEATASASKTLQLLKASAKGKFRTKGRYSAATIRGTTWTVADRCDGTLTRDVTDSVAVSDFVRHKTVVLHAGQSYLAKPRKRK